MTGHDRLRQMLRRRLDDPRFVLVGEAVGVHGLTEGFPEGPGLLRTPLSENAAIGLAAGLALGGRRPVVELVDAAGLARAGDALADLATLRRRSGGTWSAPLVVRAPWAEDVVVPEGVTVAVAATGADLLGLLGHALAGDDPVVILEAAAAHADDADAGDVPPIGTAVVRRAGSACTVLAAGDGVALALAATEGLDAEVVDLRGLAPIDARTVGESVRKTGRAVVVGAPPALLVALREAFLHLESPLVPVPVAAGAEAVARAVHDCIHY